MTLNKVIKGKVYVCLKRKCNDIHPLINWKSFLVKIVKLCFKNRILK